MAEIIIKNQKETKEGWEFEVALKDAVSRTEHTVLVDKEHYQALTGGEIEPKELVELSMEFLLEREPKEEILEEFDLRDIAQYFPEYESTISEGGL